MITKVEKPWGYELVWAKTDKYVGKVLFVRAGESLSLQYHKEKEETMWVETGKARMEVGDSEKLYHQICKHGEVIHLAPLTWHRITAITDCRIFEVSTPQLEDVVRVEDRYGR